MGHVATTDRFILTGAPGSGKTSVLRALAGLGYQAGPRQRPT
jgi:predicted ATPase